MDTNNAIEVLKELGGIVEGSNQKRTEVLGKYQSLKDNIKDSCVAEETVSYQIRPGLGERFKPTLVKGIIHDVLFEELGGKEYSATGAKEWTEKITELLRDKVKELHFERYKVMVQVVIGEQRGAGVVIATRCLWDADTDNYASEQFTNDSIFCTAMVFAVYFY